MRHQEDKQSKATSSLFLFLMIEIGEVKYSTWQGLTVTQIDGEHAASDKKIVHHACKEILANGHNPPYQLPLKFNVLLHVA